MILKKEQVASMLGCSVATVEKLARDGQLPGLKFGDEGWVFPEEALRGVLNGMAGHKMLERRELAKEEEQAAEFNPICVKLGTFIDKAQSNTVRDVQNGSASAIF